MRINTPWAPRDVSRVSDCKSLVSSSAADVNVDALYEIMMWGHDLQLAKRRKARRNVSVERSVTISRCTVLVFAHINRHMYTFISAMLWWTWRAPVKSIVTVNGGRSCSLCYGSGAGSGVGYGLPPCFLHVVQRCSRVLTYCLAVGIQ